MCDKVIPETFVMCGEDNNFCSNDCMNKAIFAQLENLNKALIKLNERVDNLSVKVRELNSRTSGLSKC